MLSNYIAQDSQIKNLALKYQQTLLSQKKSDVQNGFNVKLSTGQISVRTDVFNMEPSLELSFPNLNGTRFLAKVPLNFSKKDDKSTVVGTILAGVFFFGMFPIVIIFFYGSKLLGLMLFLGAFLIPTIGFLLGTRLGKILFNLKKVKFNKTKLYKKLAKKGYLNDFIDTINKEIKNFRKHL